MCIYPSRDRTAWAPLPWEDPERCLRNSPLMTVANVETPVMLISGDLDYIPAGQSEEYFTVSCEGLARTPCLFGIGARDRSTHRPRTSGMCGRVFWIGALPSLRKKDDQGADLVRRLDEQGQVFVPPYCNFLPAVLVKPISLMGSE